MIKIYISGNRADVIEREPLTSGTVGKVLNFAFTEDWRLLIKYAVFEGSGRRIALTNIGDSCIIPHEVLAKHGGALRVGVYGRTADGSAATPTVYAQLGIIQRGADPNADPSTKPTLPVWAQIQAQIGDLANLTTEDKTNLVAAINEAAKSGGGSGGKDGTGIESITYKGEDESGGNVYTVLLTDGTSYDITAPKGADGADGITPHIGDNGNWYLGTTDTGKPSRGETGLQGPVGPVGPQGPQGEKGDPGAKGKDGADGKSAYQYAQDGGYTGSETDFATKLAQGILSGTTKDLTPAQVYAAVSAGRPVKVQYTSSYGVMSFTSFSISETLSVIAAATIVFSKGAYILAELGGYIQSGGWFFNSTTLAEKKDIPTVPSSLPNPNALTVKIGSTTVTYDGSSAQTVEIADGTEVEY